MAKLTFITGNQSKADYLARYLGYPVDHRKIELDEIQSLDLRVVVEHKVRQAFAITGRPVIVEDVSLEFTALGRLPGTFIRFYVEEVPFETICRSLDSMSRDATARCVIGYYDGQKLEFFEGQLAGTIAQHPAGVKGFGFDKIFIPVGHKVTRASMDEASDKETYLKIKPFAKLKGFLETCR